MKAFGVAWVVALAAAGLDVSAAANLRPVRHEPESRFERNLGQYDEAVLYRGRFHRMDAAIRADATMSLHARGAARAVTLAPRSAPTRPIVEASGRSDYRTNYFREGADPIVDVPHFERVAMRDIYPGIDLAFHTRDGRFEFDFLVAPRADPGRIALVVGGADDITLAPNGDLAIRVGEQRIDQRKPVCYQSRDGVRAPVRCRYRLLDRTTVAFAVGAYNPALPLVIDPVVEYSSYVGGSAEDAVTAVKPGPGGFIYAAGWTNSSNFPVVGAFDSSLSATDVFVAKINPVTGKPVYSTYIGGRNVDNAVALAVDAAGSAYVAGLSTGRYPTTSGAYQTSTAAAGFVTKLTPAGNALSYSTLLLGTRPAGIAVDSTGRAVVTGAAGTGFTTTPGAFQSAHGGAASSETGDAFLIMLNATGNAPVFATFFGGLGTDDARGVAIDSTGRIVIAGVTGSSNLPMVDAFQPSLGGGTNDSFVAAFNSNGASLAYSTYLGGIEIDEIRSLAADPYGNVIVAGQTWSSDFPMVNARLPRSALVIRYVDFAGNPVYRKGFVTKISPSPLRIAFSTYVGSRSNCCDEAYSVAADAAGEIYATGSLNTDEFSFLTPINPFMASSYVSAKYAGSNSDAIFVTGLSRDGLAYLYQSLVAACGDAIGCNPSALGARLAGEVAVAGQSAVDWHPTTFANTQAARGSTGFGADGFVMTLASENPPIRMGITNQQPLSGELLTLIAISYSAGASGTVTFWDDTVELGTATLAEGVARLEVSLPAGVSRLTATLGAARTPLLLVPVTVSGS